MTATGTCCVCDRTMPTDQLRPEWVRSERNPTGRVQCVHAGPCHDARGPIGRRTWRDIDPDGAV